MIDQGVSVLWHGEQQPSGRLYGRMKCISDSSLATSRLENAPVSHCLRGSTKSLGAPRCDALVYKEENKRALSCLCQHWMSLYYSFFSNLTRSFVFWRDALRSSLTPPMFVPQDTWLYSCGTPVVLPTGEHLKVFAMRPPDVSFELSGSPVALAIIEAVPLSVCLTNCRR